MSRTKRDKHLAMCKMWTWKNQGRLNLYEEYMRHPIYPNEYHWLSQEPHWWRNHVKTRKRRAKCRELQHKVMKGETEQVWPLNKKPWIYWW